MKIALVHDCLREYGGAERVVEALHELWPEAPLYTSFVDWNGLGIHAEKFKNWDIRTSWMQHSSIMRKWHSPLRFLVPRVWSSFDLSDFDVVLSSSSWFMSRGVNQSSKFKAQSSKLKKPIFIDYIHTPPRNMYGYATGGLSQRNSVVRLYAEILNFFLRKYDFNISQNVDYFIANSEETKKRVWKFYRRDAEVIYPPVEILIDKSQMLKSHVKNQKEQPYYLSVGRLMYSKRVDLAIEVCNRLHVPLKIVGSGKDESDLRKLAGPTVEFLGTVSDEELSELYIRAKALLFTARDEDFGIVPVETMAQGTPVIALKEGGVKETVIEGKTGVFFNEPTVDSLLKAIKQLDHTPIQPHDCIRQANKFSKEVFQKHLLSYINSVIS
jgi:glycosyltransferase involved in cell wall biosynthesis